MFILASFARVGNFYRKHSRASILLSSEDPDAIVLEDYSVRELAVQ
jgi:hypothetical protein